MRVRERKREGRRLLRLACERVLQARCRAPGWGRGLRGLGRRIGPLCWCSREEPIWRTEVSKGADRASETESQGDVDGRPLEEEEAVEWNLTAPREAEAARSAALSLCFK